MYIIINLLESDCYNYYLTDFSTDGKFVIYINLNG